MALYLCLLFKAAALHHRIVQLSVSITDFLLAYKQFESLRQTRNTAMPSQGKEQKGSNEPAAFKA